MNALECDSQSLPKMLLKICIEKAYNSLEWNAIFTILKIIQFPNNWISWIKTYISSSNFSFLINGSALLGSLVQEGLHKVTPYHLSYSF